MKEHHKHRSSTQYKICVSGAAETKHCAPRSLERARELGEEIARAGYVLLTGATSGIPYWAAIGAKEAGGFSLGFSPAVSELAHRKSYRLPTRYFDVIVYTGFEYSGRNLLMTLAADAVIVVCGRIGTLNEFTIAFELQRPIGVLLGTGGTADMIQEILRKAKRGPGKVVYDKNPKKLLKKIEKLIRKERTKS